MRWETRQRVTTSKRGPHEPRPWGGSAAAVLGEQQGGPRGWSRGRRRWRGRPRRAPWAREDLGCDPRRVGAGEDRARGRTSGLGAQGRPLVAARRQAARQRRSRTRGPGNVGREKAGNARPRGPCAPDLLLSPGPCHRGPLQKRLTQGCLLLPRPSRQARLLRPGPPRTISPRINSKSPDLGRTVTSGNHVAPTQGVTQVVSTRPGVLGPPQGSGPLEGHKVEGGRD